jgi:hypothetical protein
VNDLSSGGPPSSPDVPAAARRQFQIVALGVLLYVVLDVVAQLLPPHYSPISQAESDLAVGPYGFVMTINFVNRGLLSLLFLVALARTISSVGGRWTQFRTGFVLVGVWGVGALLLAAFPTDVPATPVSWHGAIHLVVAVIAFFAGAFGVYFLASRFELDRLLAPARSWAVPLGLVSILLCFVDIGLPFVAPHLAGRVGGLTERLFLGSVLLWIFGVSLYLARRPARAPHPV